MEAQPKTLTAEDAGSAEDPGKSAGRGCFFESKSSQAEKTFRISTAEVAEEAEVFWGIAANSSDNLVGDEKGWANVTTPKNLCFLCYLCVSRFCF